MANETYFRLSKNAPKASATFKAVRDEVRIGLTRTKDKAVKAYQEVVANWSDGSRPGFEGKVESGAVRTSVTVRAVGNAHQLFIWKLVNETGRKPGPIFPKKAKFLRFQWGGPGSYQAKTGAGPARHSGPGTVANGETTFRRQVWHPGFEPREFDEVINPTIVVDMKRETKNGVARGLRRASR